MSNNYSVNAEEDPTINLKEVCRTCLQPSDPMLSIFCSIDVPEFNKLAIVELLKIFKEISVSPNDGLPDKICSDCLNKIHQAYTYKLQCEKSEAILMQLKDWNTLENSPNKYEHNTETDTTFIKTEITDDYETINYEQFSQAGIPELFEPDIMKPEMYLAEVKQEPEIDIEIEETEFYEIDCDKDRFKNDSQCLKCRKIFKNSTNLKVHMRVHGELPFKCEICSNGFRYEVHLQEHMIVDHPAHYTIRNDSNSENYSITIEKEQICHDGVIYIKCVLCSKLFRSKSEFYRHCPIHTTVRPFKCEICDKTFRYKRNVSDHIQREHSNGTFPKRKFNCSLCSRSCEGRAQLKNHMRVHTGEKPFPCEVCGRDFRYKHCLKEHKQRVHGIKLNTKKYNV